MVDGVNEAYRRHAIHGHAIHVGYFDFFPLFELWGNCPQLRFDPPGEKQRSICELLPMVTWRVSAWLLGHFWVLYMSWGTRGSCFFGGVLCVSLLGGVDPRTSENLQRLSRECFVVSCVSFDKRKRERQRERERPRETVREIAIEHRSLHRRVEWEPCGYYKYFLLFIRGCRHEWKQSQRFRRWHRITAKNPSYLPSGGIGWSHRSSCSFFYKSMFIALLGVAFHRSSYLLFQPFLLSILCISVWKWDLWNEME